MIKVNAKLFRVIDGDTIEVKVKVRMSKIDAPETKGIEKPQGEITENWLKQRLVEGKEIQLQVDPKNGNDVYHRLLASVYDGSVDIGQEMLNARLVEIYKPGNHNNGKLDI